MGQKFLALEELNPGDSVCINSHTKSSKGRQKRNRYEEICIKYHPNKRRKIIKDSNGNSYVYYRARKSRLTVEAFLNNMSYSEYLKCLNTWSPKIIDTLKTIPKTTCVHHINEDHTDNSLTNLKLIEGVEHSRLHADESYLSFLPILDTIISIESVGVIDTYDIKCEDPFNNFVANDFVVHNSGKSTVALNAIARNQQLKPDSWVLIIDSEMYFHERPDRVQRLQDAFGMDLEHCLIICTKQINVAFGNIFDFIDSVKSSEINLSGVLVDSWKGFENKAVVKKLIAGKIDEAADTVRGNAKAMNPILDQLVILASLSRAAFFVIQHVAVNQEEYGPDYLLPGGENLRHQADCIVFLQSLTSSDAKMADGDVMIEKSDKITEKVGKQTRFRADKTRNTVEGKQCEVWFNFKEGRFALPERSLFDLAIKLGVIYHPLNDKDKPIVAHWNFEKEMIVGADNFVEKLKTEREFFSRVQAACFPEGKADKKPVKEEKVIEPIVKKKGK
jgi:RecA/RadA recombinase